MSTNKKDLAPLTVQKTPPENNMADYLYSKATNTAIKKFPEWDVPRQDLDWELVAKQRELYDAEMRLDEKKKEAVKKRQELDAQWKDLEEKEHALRENFIKFNAFVKENQEKRERAERKIVEETELSTRREDEILELKKNYENMFKVRIQMDQNIKSHKMYEEYLSNVVKIYPSFRTLDDILDRYEALAEARKILAERQEEDLSALEAARTEMIKITEEKSLKIMGLYNVMAELQSRYEIAKNKALQWELMVTNIKDTCAAKLDELFEVQNSCWNVYVQMCKRKEIRPVIDKEDVEKQLMFIKRTMLELKKITKDAKRTATKNRFTKPMGKNAYKH